MRGGAKASLFPMSCAEIHQPRECALGKTVGGRGESKGGWLPEVEGGEAAVGMYCMN